MKFNPDLHEYLADDGTIISSVTQVLKEAGIIDDRWYTAEARDKGTAAHKLCERYAFGERYDKHGRELSSLPYVNAFAGWMSDYGVWTIATECRVYHRINGKPYAGTFDVLADIGNKRVLIDLKTGAKAKWHAVQLAAYAMATITGHPCLPDHPVNPDRCAVLYIKADGTYKYDPIPGSRLVSAIQEFKECL